MPVKRWCRVGNMDRIIKAARVIFSESLVKGHMQAKRDDSHHVVAEQVGLKREDSVMLEPDNLRAIATLLARDEEIQTVVYVMLVKMLEELDYANCALNNITEVEPFLEVLPEDEPEDTLVVSENDLIIEVG